MSMKEAWKPVVGFEGLYEVSNRGRIRSCPRVVNFSDGRAREYRGQLISQYDGAGYPRVTLKRNRVGERLHVHVLVAEAWIGPCPEGHVVRHWDGNPQRNVIGNVLYGTYGDNIRDAQRHGTFTQGFTPRLSAADVKAIRAARGVFTGRELAEKYNTSPAHVCNIQRGNRRAAVR